MRRFNSLHARLLALSAGATLLALGLAGLVMAGLLERFVTAGLDRRLDAEVTLLASVVDANGRIERGRLHQRLGALDNGPGWTWRIVAPGGTLGSADFPQLDPAPPAPPLPGPVLPTPGPDRLRPLEGGREGGRVHARQLTIRTGEGLVTLTAAAPRDVVRRPIRGALEPLLATLAALAAVLTFTTLLQVRLGFRPLRRLRDQVAAIRAGTGDRVDEDQPAELRPLAIELNALARANARSLETARLSAANLAHALKTPVAALALEVAENPTLAAQVGRLDATIRHHLARARAETANRRMATPVGPSVADLIGAVRALHKERALAITTEIEEALTVALDPHDLDELVGNLLDNAARHATGRIWLRAASQRDDRRWLTMEIADDGPGIPADERERMARPGTRLDERGDGHGFGLAIATELVALYGGTLRMDGATDGGLLVRLTLPVAPA